MAKYHGRKGLVYFSTTGTGAAVSVANMSEWSLNFSVDRVEVTAFGDANKTYVQGLKDVQGQFSGFYDDTATASIFTAADSTDGIKVYLYPSSDSTARYFYGPAWLDASITTSVNDAVKISGSLAANGSWGYKLS